jgi:hypothetical protein
MKPERADIALPEFPSTVRWINVPYLPTNTLLGSSVSLVWFWDYCSLNSLRSLPYLQEWNRRYSDFGLRVIGVHSPQFGFGADHSLVEDAVNRLGIEFAIAPDPDFQIWKLYGAEVWPSLYLWDRRGLLRHYQFGEGAYDETEIAVQELLREIDGEAEFPEPMPPLRRTDHPGALVRAPTAHSYLEEDRSGHLVRAGEELVVHYQAATAAAVLEGGGRVDVIVDGKRRRTIQLDRPRLYKLVESGQHEDHELKLFFRDDSHVYAFSFAPGLA